MRGALFVLLALIIAVKAAGPTLLGFELHHPESQVPLGIAIPKSFYPNNYGNGPAFEFAINGMYYANGHYQQFSDADYRCFFRGGRGTLPGLTTDELAPRDCPNYGHGDGDDGTGWYWEIVYSYYFYEPSRYYNNPIDAFTINYFSPNYAGFNQLLVERVYSNELFWSLYDPIFLDQEPEYYVFYGAGATQFGYDGLGFPTFVPVLRKLKFDNTGWLVDFARVYNTYDYPITLTLGDVAKNNNLLNSAHHNGGIRYGIEFFDGYTIAGYRDPEDYLIYRVYGSYHGPRGENEINYLDRWFIPYVPIISDYDVEDEGLHLKKNYNHNIFYIDGVYDTYGNPKQFTQFADENYEYFYYINTAFIAAFGSQLDYQAHTFPIYKRYISPGVYDYFYGPGFPFFQVTTIPAGGAANFLRLFKMLDGTNYYDVYAWYIEANKSGYYIRFPDLYQILAFNGVYDYFYLFTQFDPNIEHHAKRIAHRVLDSEQQMREYVSPNGFPLLGFLSDYDLYNTINWDFKFVYKPVCGDGVCVAATETNYNCPEDCYCGDEVCSSPFEDAVNCGFDCAAICGNNICEEYEFYPACGDCDSCGDGVCQLDWENAFDCPDDCGINPVIYSGDTRCGDGICSPGETHTTCHSDCSYFGCGNDICEMGEWITCPTDCHQLNSVGN